MIARSFRDALNKTPQLGFCSMYASPGIIERIGQDWDWCWIDGQHGEWGTQDTVQAVRACNLAGIYALVRVPGHEQGTIGKMLDTACHAIMVPMVETADQARAVVQAARFAPVGHRSYGGRRPIDLYGRAYAHADRPQPLVVCQIESPAAVAQAEAIAAVNGVDALFFGPDDMALAGGMPMDRPRPEGCFDDALAAVANAATRHGKIAAGVFPTMAAQKQALGLGQRLLVCAGDVSLLAPNSQIAAKASREALGNGSVREAARPASLY